MTKNILRLTLLFAWAVAASAQEGASTTQEKQSPPSANGAQLVPNTKPGPRRALSRDEATKLLKEAREGKERGEALSRNYRITFEHTFNGKTASFSFVTAQLKFRYDGIAGGVDVDGNSIPSTLEFTGELSRETEDAIFLKYFFGRTVPYATGSSRSSDGKKMNSQITQLRLGMDNGALFSFGKPLKLAESEGETLVITVQKVEP